MKPYVRMITLVAEALGSELLQQMAFVGGCTTGLLLTDAFSQEQVRHTDDVGENLIFERLEALVRGAD